MPQKLLIWAFNHLALATQIGWAAKAATSPKVHHACFPPIIFPGRSVVAVFCVAKMGVPFLGEPSLVDCTIRKATILIHLGGTPQWLKPTHWFAHQSFSTFTGLWTGERVLAIEANRLQIWGFCRCFMMGHFPKRPWQLLFW